MMLLMTITRRPRTGGGEEDEDGGKSEAKPKLSWTPRQRKVTPNSCGGPLIRYILNHEVDYMYTATLLMVVWIVGYAHPLIILAPH